MPMLASLQRLEKFPNGALLLDMDGLLVDSEPLWFRVERDFCNARGGAWTDAHAAECIGKGMAATFRRMSEEFGIAIDPERDKEIVVDAVIDRVREIELKPGGRELLDAAAEAEIPLALASSSSLRLILAVLDRFGITPRFGAVVSGESVAKPKPAPDIFLKAAAELGVPPSACVVLEDSIAGATAGRAAEMAVIAVPEGPWEGRGFEAVADAIVPDLFAAWRLLRRPG
jgi:HAD superfamily hydrolase (TIGR01509 family)